MKFSTKYLLAAAVIALSVVNVNAQTTPAGGTAKGINSTWSIASYPANTPTCSSTVVTNCQDGYTYTITGPTGNVVTIPNCHLGVASTATTPCINSTTTSYLWEPNGGQPGLFYGSYSFSLVTNAIGCLAAPPAACVQGDLVSTPSTASLTYAPPATVITISPAPGALQPATQN